MTELEQEMKMLLAELIRDNPEVTSTKMSKVSNGNVYILTVSCL